MFSKAKKVYKVIPKNGKRGKTNLKALQGKKGLYKIFENKKLVYIGKSYTNLYRTVLRHFQAWNDSAQLRRISYVNNLDSKEYTYSIELTPKATELQLMKKELALIIKYNPIDNKKDYVCNVAGSICENKEEYLRAKIKEEEERLISLGILKPKKGKKKPKPKPKPAEEENDFIPFNRTLKKMKKPIKGYIKPKPSEEVIGYCGKADVYGKPKKRAKRNFESKTVKRKNLKNVSAKRNFESKKKFNNKFYTLINKSTFTKLQADKKTKELRKAGKLCRRVKTGKKYLIYACKK
jgi:hypothetical protein